MIKSEIRKDYIQDKYVIIAPYRSKRPHYHDPVNFDLIGHGQKELDQDCVFCTLNVNKAKLLVGSKKKWQTVVIPNKFPAVTLSNPKAYGQQEVVVETPNHNLHIEDLPQNYLVKILKIYAARTKNIMANSKIEYILIFKNNGGRAGASILHSHSQIFATSFLPPHLSDKSQRAQAYKLKTGRCVYCDVVKREGKGPRLVYLDKHTIAFTPYASMYNYELWIMTRRHLDNITNLNSAELKSFAAMLHKVLTKISHNLQLPYNYYFHQVVHDEDQHLYLKITPRGTPWAGVEIGSGLIINPIAPEKAAKFYRS
ncbi:MAG: galactose-1-phosphate uridylyltransferase [Patescibacteria group bacterium]